MIKKLCMFVLFTSAMPAFAEVTYQDFSLAESSNSERMYYSEGKKLATQVFDPKGVIVKRQGSVPDGIARNYYSPGKVRGEISVVDNKVHGFVRTYYENGQIEMEARYTRGVRNGHVRKFRPDGKLMSESWHRAGIANGWQTKYYRNGQLLSRMYFRDGKKDGILAMYFESGSMAYKSFYENGKRLGKIDFDEQGKVIARQGADVPDKWKPWEELLSEDEKKGIVNDPIKTTIQDQAGSPRHIPGNELFDGMTHTLVLFGNITYENYAMGDINGLINNWNDYFDFYGGTRMSGIAGGSNLNLGAEYWLSNLILLGVEGTLMSAETSGGTSSLGAEFNLSAIELGGFIKFAELAYPHVFSAGFGIYSVSLHNSTEYNYMRQLGYYDGYRTFDGSVVGVKLMGGYQVILGDIGIGVDLGYRFAKVNNIKWTASGYHDRDFLNIHGDKGSIDFSGFFVKAGIKIYVK